MEPERAKRITEIFKSVLAAPREERATKLERACAGDSELRREVRELLRASERAWDSGALDPQKIPQAIGKYEIIERIGQGGFGEVFRGRDPVIQRDVAVKLCISADEALKQRFFREVQIVGRLKHSNITTVHDSGSFGDVPYMVQEYLPGEDLAQLIRGRRRIAASARLDYLVQVARGLEYAHGMGVIHRDVKPSNIFVLTDGTVKILDFGIARLLSAQTHLTATGTRIGTECYMAPEQLCGETADVQADIFSFGVVAYELLTYVHPFRADHGPAMIYKVLEEDPVPLSELWPSCPPELDDCVAHCLEKEAKDRPAGMAEVLARLERLELSGLPLSTTSTDATLVRSPRPSRRPPRRSAWPRRAALAGTLVLGLAAFFVVRELVGPAPQEPPAEAATEEAGAPAEETALPAKQTALPTESAAPPEPRAESLDSIETAKDEPSGGVESAEKETTSPAVREDGVARRETSAPGTREDPAEEAIAPAPSEAVLPTPPVIAVDAGRAEPPARTLPTEDVTPSSPREPTAASSPPEAAPGRMEEIAPPPPPAPAAVPGSLVINALPWASIVRVAVAGSPETVSLPSRYTPLAFALPPGLYEVELSGAGSAEHRCEVEVRSGAAAACLVRLVRIRERDFFARDQQEGPNARPPQPRPDDPGPGGPGRGDPRGLPPRLDPPLQGPPRREKVPGWIRDSAQAFFDGDYANALDLLTQDTAKKKLQRFYVGLFRGASRYSVYLLTGERDSSLAEAAAAELKECRRQRPGFVPHPDFFSPRFIEFFSVSAAP